MPWNVRIVGERGQVFSAEDVILEFRVLENLPSESKYLEGIDKYQDTTFNSQQLRLLLPEWDALRVRLNDDADQAAWCKVREYAERCIEHPHWFLRFVGD